MKLLIHDLKDEDIKAFGEFEGWETVSDDGTIKPCVGCFCCWHKDPGQCIVRDGYENMGALIHRAEEVCVISRYTYGGFSGFVKNVFDRSLGYVLPQLTLAGTETHHKKRYEEDKPFSFIFYGRGLGDDEKKSAERYVTAVCANIRGHVEELRFVETEECAPQPSETDAASFDQASDGSPSDPCDNAPGWEDTSDNAPGREAQSPESSGKVLLINASMRSENGNSAKLARRLADMLTADSEIAALKDYRNDPLPLVRQAEKASALILCMPLYVDGLPSQLIRFMEYFEKEYKGTPKKVYAVANMGLYESSQLVNLFDAVRQWCACCGLEYCGAFGVSAGELIGTFMEHVPMDFWPGKKAAKGLQTFADAINGGLDAGSILTEPWAFPRGLYLAVVNINWNKLARKNGLKPRDLYRQL